MSRIVTAARSWIGTPYVHQASRKGAGCDCLGLIRGLWRELYGAEPEALPAYTMDWSEPQGAEALWQAAARHLAAKPLADAAPGDVILFRMREGSVAKHLGVQSIALKRNTRAATVPRGEGEKRPPRGGGGTGAARAFGPSGIHTKWPCLHSRLCRARGCRKPAQPALAAPHRGAVSIPRHVLTKELI